MSSQMRETSEEHGHSVMSIITSLHKPAQLYARLNMNSYRTGLTALILTLVLGDVVVFFTLFALNHPLDLSPDRLLNLVSSMMPGILQIVWLLTFIFATSVTLALIFRYVIHQPVGFSVPFTIVSISYVPYGLLRLCIYWLILMVLFDPFSIVPKEVSSTLPTSLTFLYSLTTLIFYWYLVRGILAVTKLQMRYAVLIAVAAFVIVWIVSYVEIAVYAFLLYM